ncbi:MAG: LegC family aminotransferase [Pseudomonadota bacterium]
MSAAIPPSVSAIVAAARAALPVDRAEMALHEPEFRGAEWTYVKECLDTNWVSSVGSYVDRFEAQLRDCTGIATATATVNGTAALHMALLLSGVQHGDEVLTPTLTFVATANAVCHAGATPHFVDCEPRTLGVDAARLDHHLRDTAELHGSGCRNRRSGAPIRALMAMHVFGHPCEIEALAEVCARWQLTLIEDAAESLGSFYRGRHTGHVGYVAALSFNGNKIVTTGGGGAVLSNDIELGRRAKHLTTTARVPHPWLFLHDEVGYNYRLPNLNAALGCAQMERLPDFLERKRRLAGRYADAFRDVGGVSVLHEPPQARSNYWLNTLLLDQPDLALRDAALVGLNDAGIRARPAWTLMHKLPMYSVCPRMPLPVAELLEARIINLPSSASLGS